MSWLFFLVFFPLVVCLLFWAVLAAIKIFTSEDAAVEVRRAYADRAKKHARQPMKVGARDISEDSHFRTNQGSTRYVLSEGVSAGLPREWVDDVWNRRN